MHKLSLYPFLDFKEWNEWRDALTQLHENLSGMSNYLTQEATRSASAIDRMKTQRTLTDLNIVPNAPDFREPTVAVQLKYLDLDLAMKAYAPYSPLALTFYEPPNASERYFWLQSLRLSFPIAIIKVVVGGSLGVLAWVLKRDPDMIDIGDGEELEEARRLIEPVVPQVRREYPKSTPVHHSHLGAFTHAQFCHPRAHRYMDARNGDGLRRRSEAFRTCLEGWHATCTRS